jgi:hypothetical protein
MRTPRRAGRLVSLLCILCAVVAVFTACAGTGGPTPSGGGVPGNATHPQPKEETFQGCPPQGDGGFDSQLNELKNRVDDGVNGQYTPVSLDSLLQLTWPQDTERVSRSEWSQQDTASVAQSQDVAVQVTGYVLMIRHEGTESTNCHATDYRDFHVWLAVNPSDSRSQSMVVEVTPRVRDMRSGWTDSALSGLVGQQVRISGWTLYDQEHPEQLGQTRQTLWEIHPILHIDVSQGGGGWQSIDS